MWINPIESSIQESPSLQVKLTACRLDDWGLSCTSDGQLLNWSRHSWKNDLHDPRIIGPNSLYTLHIKITVCILHRFKSGIKRNHPFLLSNRKQAHLIVFVIGNSVLLCDFCLYQTKEITPISPLEMMGLKREDTFNAWYVILYNVYVLESVHFSFPTWPMGQAMQLGDLGLDFGAALELFPGWTVLTINSPTFNGELS